MTKKALVAVKDGKHSRRSEFVLPALKGTYQLVGERTGQPIKVATVVYTGQEITLKFLLDKMQTSAGASLRSTRENKKIARAFLDEIVKFKVGAFVEVVNSSSSFQLAKIKP